MNPFKTTVIITPCVPMQRYGEIFPRIKQVEVIQSLYIELLLFYCAFEYFQYYLSSFRRRIFNFRDKLAESKIEYGMDTDAEVSDAVCKRILDSIIADEYEIVVIVASGQHDMELFYNNFINYQNLYPNMINAVYMADIQTAFEDTTVYEIKEDEDIPNLWHCNTLINVNKYKDDVYLPSNESFVTLKEIQNSLKSLPDDLHEFTKEVHKN